MEDGREAAEERGHGLWDQERTHPRPGQDHPHPHPPDKDQAPPGVSWQGQSPCSSFLAPTETQEVLVQVCLELSIFIFQAQIF